MSTEQLEIFIRANVQNLTALSELQGKMAAVGAEADSLRVKSLASGGLGITGSVTAGSAAEASQMVANLEAAGVATSGFRVKTIDAAKEVGILERDGVRAGTNLARTFSAMGDQTAGAFERIASSAGMLGMGGTAGLAIGGGLVAAGGLLAIGKSAVDNAEAAEAADRSLAQAAEVAGQSYTKLKAASDAYVASNRSFITNQYEAEQALALFTRAGNNQTTTTEAMNASLDLATLKHLSLTDAARMVELAMMGNGRAVRELGIDLKTLSASQDVSETATANLDKAQTTAATAADHLAATQRSLQEEEDALHAKRTVSQLDLDHLKDKQDAVAKAQLELAAANQAVKAAQDAVGTSQARSLAILDELNSKVQGGRDATTDLEQAQNRLHNTWQKLTADDGPALIGAFAGVLEATDAALTGMNKWADSAAPKVNDALVGIARNLKGVSQGTDDGTRSWGGWTYQVGQVGTATEIAAHAASEHADVIDHTSLTVEVASHALSEHSDALRHNQTELVANRDESYNVAAANQRVRDELDQLSRSNEIAAHTWDEHHQSAAETDRALQAANTSVQNVRESIAHANQERLDIKVDASALAALRGEIQGIFNQQYVLHFQSEHNPYDGSGGVSGGGFGNPTINP